MAGVSGIKAGQAYVSVLSDDTPLIRGLRGLESQFKGFGQRIGAIGGQVATVGAGITGLGAAGLAALGWPLSLAAEMETAQTQFTTLLKDADAAKTLLGELQQFAASTPFQFPELADAGRKLLAFGSAAGDVQGELKRIGDISAGIGAPIGEIAEIYGKARVNGRLFADDINQLTGRGIPVIQELAKQFGVTDQEVKQLVEDGAISFANLERAFIDLTSTAGQFGGGMQALSQTFGGQMSTLRDNILAAFRPFGEALLPAAKAAVGAISGIVAKFSEWASANKQIVLPIAAALAGVVAIGGAATAAGVALIGLGSAISAIGAIGGAVATVAGAVSLPVLGTIAAVAAGVAFVGSSFAAAADAAGLLRPAIAFIWSGFQQLWLIASQTLGGITSALASGDFGRAASIAWAGVTLAALKGTQMVLRGVEYLWDNAGRITQRFFAGVATITYKTFAALPKLAWAAIRGGAALQQALQGVFVGVFSSDIDLAGSLDPAIKRAEAKLNALTLQATPTLEVRPQASPVRVDPPPMNFAPPQMPIPTAAAGGAAGGQAYAPTGQGDAASHLAYMLGESVDMSQAEPPPPSRSPASTGVVAGGLSPAELLIETNRILRQIQQAGGLT